MTEEDRMRAAWRESEGGTTPPALETVRRAAAEFDRRVSRRNRIETIAAALVVVVFAAYAFVLPSPLMRTASLMVIAGTVVVIWQLFRRAGSLAPADAAGMTPLLRHRRDALDRQRRALAGVPLWYVGPLVPGLTLFLAAPFLEGARLQATSVLWLGVTAAVLAGVIWLNRRAARELAREVAEIDAQLAER